MKIVEITQYDENVMEALNRLLPQLASSIQPLTREQLTEIIDSEASHLLMAEEDGHYCGSLTLSIVRIPTGIKAWIEDVVVDTDFRGRGIGRLLTEHGIDLARSRGADCVNLTSRPSREAANALYQKMGFELRDTNMYRYTIRQGA